MDINQNYREAVKSIKEAILRSQYRAAASVNKEQLSLYYGIGRYVSENSRTGFWGKGAIEQISSLLQKELPGLRGFSASNIKNMRIFYEAWESVLNRQPLADDLVLDEKLLLVEIRQPLADEFNWSDFLSIGFSHHTEIISKAKTLEARLFYIHECATRYWSKYTLKSATKLFSVLLASKRPLITELADKLRLKYPLLPTISPCPTMRLEAIRSIIPISCRRYPKSV